MVVSPITGHLALIGPGRRERLGAQRSSVESACMAMLADALSLESLGDGRWATVAHPHQQSISGMFGGWTTAVALNAVCQASQSEMTPGALSINFVSMIEGDAAVEMRPERLGGGRSVEHWRVDLRDGGGVVAATATVTLVNRRPSDGHLQARMPESPDLDELETSHAPPPQGDQTVIRPVKGYPWFATGDTSSSHWVKDMSGRSVDHLRRPRVPRRPDATTVLLLA